jgi:hypothetical protein
MGKLLAFSSSDGKCTGKIRETAKSAIATVSYPKREETRRFRSTLFSNANLAEQWIKSKIHSYEDAVQIVGSEKMSRSEQAWESVSSRWHPFEPTSPDENERIRQIRSNLMDLQGMRLPIVAIDKITALMSEIENMVLENSWCPRCGVRADGQVECTQCHQMCDESDVDSIRDICSECQQENDDEEDGL